jgi:hypothetical protein
MTLARILLKHCFYLNIFVYTWFRIHEAYDMWAVPFVSDNLEGSEINIRSTTEFIFYGAPVFARSTNSERKSDEINQFPFASR